MATGEYKTLGVDVVRGVLEAADITRKDLPVLGMAIDHQITRLRVDLKGTSFGEFLEKGIKAHQLDNTIHRYLAKNKDELITEAAGYNPYLFKWFISDPLRSQLFWAALKETPGHLEMVKELIEKQRKKFKDLLSGYPTLTDLTKKAMSEMLKDHIRLDRPIIWIKTFSIFSDILESNFYRYKGDKCIALQLPEYELYAVINLAKRNVSIRSLTDDATQWFIWDNDRAGIDNIHLEVVRRAMKIAERNNDRHLVQHVVEPAPPRIPPPPPEPSPEEIIQSRVSSILSGLVFDCTKEMVYDPNVFGISVCVLFDSSGDACDPLSGDIAEIKKYYIPPITNPVETDHRALFKTIYSKALVVRGSNYIKLPDYVSFITPKTTIKEMAKRISPI